MKSKHIALSWQLSDLHGWGVFGFNLVRHLLKNGPLPPMLLSPPSFHQVPDDLKDNLHKLMVEQRRILAEADGSVDPRLTVLHSLGNGAHHDQISDRVQGRTNIGFIFFELDTFDSPALERANRYDRMLAGSSWNRDLLKSRGVIDVEFVSQGVDIGLFKPQPKQGTFGDRFVVYSGGKIELRKGQDLVVAAFRQFQVRHPEALLITSWQNHWPQTYAQMDASPHISTNPKQNENGNVDIITWAQENGIPGNALVDIGWQPNARIATILQEADVAIFPNRCEGGTNLVAMEAMACGVPTILSANTGHLDLIDGKNCYPLTTQTPINDPSGQASMWRDSSVEEIIENLEQVYADQKEAKRRGVLGAETMANLSWTKQMTHLTDAISDLL